MVNKYSSSLGYKDPFGNLTRKEISIYYLLLEKHQEIKRVNAWEGFIDRDYWDSEWIVKSKMYRDGSFNILTKDLATFFGTDVSCIPRYLSRLAKQKLIELDYIPSKYGEIRKIYVKEIQNAE